MVEHTKNKENSLKNNIEKSKAFKSSLIFYINTSMFFISLITLVLLEYTAIDILLNMLFISLTVYSSSIILVSLLIKYDEYHFLECDKEIKLKNYLHFNVMLENQISFLQSNKVKEELDLSKKELDLENFEAQGTSDIQISSFKLKIEEDMHTNNN
jgi:hypothetical protein